MQQSPLPLTASRRAELLDSARRHRADQLQQQQQNQHVSVRSNIDNYRSTLPAKQVPEPVVLAAEKDSAEIRQLQNELRLLDEEIERESRQVSSSTGVGDYAHQESKQVAALLRDARARAISKELPTLSTNQQQQQQQRNQKQRRDEQLRLHSHLSASSSSSASSTALLREVAAIAAKISSVNRSIHETQSGPLAELQRRHDALAASIADCQSKIVLLNFESERLERCSLIARYRCDIPMLRQELSMRPPHNEVKQFRERLQQQVEHLSEEMASTLNDLKLFDEEVDNAHDGNNSSIKSESDALAMDISALQDQLSGLLDYVSSQRDLINSWTKREVLRHEDFMQCMTRERDELLTRCRARGLLLLLLDEEASPMSSCGGDDLESSFSVIDESSGGGAGGGDNTNSRKRGLVEVVLCDLDTARVTETQTHRAPRLRVKFCEGGSDGTTSTSAVAGDHADSTSDHQTRSGKGATSSSVSSSSSSNSLRSVLMDIYAPPLVSFENKAHGHSLTVRLLGSISSFLFGDSAWVQTGRQMKRKSKQGEVVV